MFYYRRKILLALIQKFNRELLATPLQKNLFLLTRQQKDKSYDFIPYKYGCYSLLANQDLSVLEKMGYIGKRQRGMSTAWYLLSNDNFIDQIKNEDLAALNYVYATFHKLSVNDLIRHTYINYPFWAINSIILEDVLGKAEKQKVLLQKKDNDQKGLFTIGYEGISLEQYFNKLIIAGVNVLCDVRKNPLSKKWGFSKSILRDTCEKVGIEYVHYPQLGIESEDRQKLNSLADYRILFCSYERTTLVDSRSYLLDVAALFENHKRVALTCFEHDVQMCHRGVVAKALLDLTELSGLKLQHL